MATASNSDSDFSDVAENQDGQEGEALPESQEPPAVVLSRKENQIFLNLKRVTGLCLKTSLPQK